MPRTRVTNSIKRTNGERIVSRTISGKVTKGNVQTLSSRVVSSDEVVGKIASMKLQRIDAIAVKKGIDTLENISLSDLSNTSKVVKIKNCDSYALKVSKYIRLMFGIDEQTKKVLLYDIVDLRHVK